MKLPRLSSPLKLFSPAPAQPALGMAGFGGNMMFASGGGGGYDPDDDFDDFDDQPVEPERRPRATRSSRQGGEQRSPASGGRPRTTQFQPEERYWTDYLRIALPVVGILLMLGLLWFWADRLISDDSNPSEPVATEEIGLVTTGSPTAPAQIQSTPPPADTTVATEAAGTGNNQANNPAETPPTNDTTEAATEAPVDTGASFTDGEAVVVTEDVNLRPNPSTEGDPLMVVPAGEELTITGGPKEGESFVWWEVLTSDGSTTGWVVEQYLEPAG